MTQLSGLITEYIPLAIVYNMFSIKYDREAEAKLQDMTGYRLKIVERAGLKLEDILHKADPWQGQDCKHEKCLLCLTKSRTDKNTTQDCSRRSLVYETWCMTCHETDLDAAKIEAGDDEKKLKMLIDKIKKHKYIGETSLIYSKSEFNRCRVPRLKIDMEGWRAGKERE